jgi:GT2 family glycosyltransferase/glycosyltransferase involved in cell wall biosynthesis
MAPSDQNLCFVLACLRLSTGDAQGAAALFADIVRAHDVRECWTGLASASLQSGRIAAAQSAVQHALSSHAVEPALASIAGQVVNAAGLPGWCGVRGDGTVLVLAPHAELTFRLDGRAITVRLEDGIGRLPPSWRRARRLAVSTGGEGLLGSPVALERIRRVEGFVARTPEGIAGWAWTPGSPEQDPKLRIRHRRAPGEAFRTRIVTASRLLEVDGTRPLARPRAFTVPIADGAEVHVLGADGRHLLGSPLPSTGRSNPCLASDRPVHHVAEPALPVDVIIPVYRGLRVTLDCLDSVIRTVSLPHRIVVVDDDSPEPELVAALEELDAAGALTLIRPVGSAGGFPAAVNTGLRFAAGRHVVLLNSDTLVAPGWLTTLRQAACSAPDIGTATPLSNEASIFSVPEAEGGNTAPDLAETRRWSVLAAQANAGRLVDVPTAHGFCMFIRRDCLDATGLFEESLFAQGYGEENDFCERARMLGFRHVAVTEVFVAHRGGVSFGAAGQDLLARNLALLHRRHPGYASRVADFLAADPLAPARRRLDAARWRARPDGEAAGGSVLLVTHGGGGGTARIVGERAQALRDHGLRPIVLQAKDGLCVVGDARDRFPNLSYLLPDEIGPLRRLLAADRPVSAELHHLLGHDHSVLRLLAELALPYEIWVHDYAWFCARLSFVTGEGRFCGEAPPSVCETCLALWGRGIEDPIAPAALRLRSAADLRAASRVVVPSADVARRVMRHVPGLVPHIMPWEPAPAFRTPAVRPTQGFRRVAVVGAIGLEKGYGVLLDCARDAAARALALEFVVVGYTVDDEALLQTGRAFVTGEFQRDEATSLIDAQDAQLAFLPSVWPETWCYALSDAWAAGLSAAVFDIGTPADRIRQSGAGWVLPLGLPAPRINDVLLSL